ncbi:MAG TPA: glycoside hydrolase family 30 beta sandwich domain-containing protein [Terriglobia bacterium]
MSKRATRRDFLKTATAGVAAAASLRASPPPGAPMRPGQSAGGAIEVRVTDSRRKFAAAEALTWRPAPPEAARGAIRLDPATRFQEHLGIGGAFTDAACYMFSQLADPAREELFHEMFHPSEMGLGVGRICIGSSDYSRNVYSFDEGAPDPDLARFSIDHDRAYILPILQQARGVNPELFLLASPWSPPGWMKPNGSMLGGCMHRSSMPAYAQYFVKFLQAYKDARVPINAVSSQNEVDTEQDGRMPACAWPQEYEISFVSEHLGPALRRNAIDSKIWLLDHNYNLWGRAICCLDEPALREYCQAVAWHGYVGTPDMVMKVHETHPEVEMFWTEGGPDYTQPDYLTDWSKWGATFTGVLRNWCRSIIGWNLALDEKGRPNIGPFSCGGTVTINSEMHEITRSGHFWATNHFARSVRRGAQRFDSQGGPAEVQHVAFESPEGKRVLVLTNPGAARTVLIQLAGNVAEAALAADSSTTLAWS